jgi:hypothetical protein
MPDFFSLSARGFTTTVLIAGGGVTLAEGAGCPSEVPATAMVTTPAEVVDGLGVEEEGLQHRQSKQPTHTRLDNSTRRRPHTWWVRLCLLYACVPPDDLEGLMARLLPTPRMIRGSCSCSPSLQLPSPPGVSRFQLSRRWANRQMIEPFLLQLRRWEEGGMVGGCRLVAGNSSTTPCVPAEASQSTEVPEQQKLFQVVKTLSALEDFVRRTAPGRMAPC